MGPLPVLYRVLVSGVVVVLSVVVGVGVAERVALPLGGFGVGTAIGGLLAYLLVHDFQHTRSRS